MEKTKWPGAQCLYLLLLLRFRVNDSLNVLAARRFSAAPSWAPRPKRGGSSQSCLDPSSGSILDTILSLYPRLWLSSPILDNPLFTPCFIALTLNERRGGKKLWKVSVCCCCKSLGSSRRTVEGIDEWPLKDLVALLSVCRREIMCFGTIKDLTKVF